MKNSEKTPFIRQIYYNVLCGRNRTKIQNQILQPEIQARASALEKKIAVSGPRLSEDTGFVSQVRILTTKIWEVHSWKKCSYFLYLFRYSWKTYWSFQLSGDNIENTWTFQYFFSPFIPPPPLWSSWKQTQSWSTTRVVKVHKCVRTYLLNGRIFVISLCLLLAVESVKLGFLHL